ncbi:MAG: helix-turn-helix transcriptional regulator [Chloroflexota bacterium]
MSNENQKRLAFSKLLNLLFEHIRDEEGQVFTDTYVSKVTGMSQSSISSLRRNLTSNPRLDNVKAIADFFGVSLNYFSAESVEEAIDLIAQRNEERSVDIELAARFTNLSDEARQDLERILRWVQKADNTRR